MVSPYTRDFQINLLAHMARDAKLLATCRPILKPADLELPACQLLYEVLVRYHVAYATIPPNAQILQLLVQQALENTDQAYRTVLAPEDMELLFYCLDVTAKLTALNSQFFQDELKGYLTHVRVKQAVEGHVAGGANPNNLIADVKQIDQDVRKVSGSIVLDNMDTNPEPILDVSQVQRFPTTLSRLNMKLSGGIEREKLALIVACPGVGKTTCLINFCHSSIQCGTHSLFITLEMSAKRIKHRFQSIAGNIDAKWFKRPIPEWPKRMQYRYAQMLNPTSKFYGYNSIVDLSKEQHPVAAVEDAIRIWRDSLLSRGVQESELGPVYLDWLDMLDPRSVALTKDTKDHDLLSRLCYEIIHIVHRQKTTIWTATQGTREAVGHEKMTQKHVAAAFHKVDALDFAIGLAPKSIEDETDPDAGMIVDTKVDTENLPVFSRGMVCSVLKNRDDPMGFFDFFQGPTLKFWDNEAASIAAMQMLAAKEKD